MDKSLTSGLKVSFCPQPEQTPLVGDGALQPSGTNSSNTQHKIRSADGCVVPEGDLSGNLSKWTRMGLSNVSFCSPELS